MIIMYWNQVAFKCLLKSDYANIHWKLRPMLKIKILNYKINAEKGLYF